MTKHFITACMYLLLAGGISIASSTYANAWVIDDGETEITPVYVMTHTHGQSYTFVRADFWFWDAKKSVKLQPNASVSVNGVELRGESPNGSYTYVGNIPVAEGKLIFKVVRTPTITTEHSFELPALDISIFPEAYRPHEPVLVPLRDFKKTDIGKTSFNLDIQFADRIFPLTGRLENNELIFKPIIKTSLPTGIFDAHIYRQQRVPLSEISNAKSGWAVASNSRDFKIQVLSGTQ